MTGFYRGNKKEELSKNFMDVDPYLKGKWNFQDNLSAQGIII